jgi:hypothetical protein
MTSFIFIYVLSYLWIFSNASIFEGTKSVTEEVISVLTVSNTLVFINIILLVSFLYIRNLTQYYYGGESLISVPIPLTKKTSYPVHYIYEYTLSFWINIEAMPPSYSLAATQYTNVLYGSNLMIVYNGAENKLRTIMKTDAKPLVIDIPDVPLQKWNHLLISYSNGVFDFFMNNELIKTSNIISEETHELVVGSENGIRGEICNFLFFDKVISPEKMDSLYNDFKSKNPPTF